MKKSWVFLGSAGAMCLLALWGCQFNTVDRASQYEGSYDASLPPVKDGGDAAAKPPTQQMDASQDDGGDEDGGSSDAGDGGNG